MASSSQVHSSHKFFSSNRGHTHFQASVVCHWLAIRTVVELLLTSIKDEIPAIWSWNSRDWQVKPQRFRGTGKWSPKDSVVQYLHKIPNMLVSAFSPPLLVNSILVIPIQVISILDRHQWLHWRWDHLHAGCKSITKDTVINKATKAAINGPFPCLKTTLAEPQRRTSPRISKTGLHRTLCWKGIWKASLHFCHTCRASSGPCAIPTVCQCLSKKNTSNFQHLPTTFLQSEGSKFTWHCDMMHTQLLCNKIMVYANVFGKPKTLKIQTNTWHTQTHSHFHLEALRSNRSWWWKGPAAPTQWKWLNVRHWRPWTSK